MDEVIYGNLQEIGFEIVQRDEKRYVRYDAGAHQVAWREDEITEEEYAQITGDKNARNWGFIGMQKRLIANGIDPYRENWKPS